MRAIRIDAEKQVVEEVLIDQDSTLEDMQRYVGGLIDICAIDGRNDLVINDEGALQENYVFIFEFSPSEPHLFYGNGLVVGQKDGETTGTRLSVESIKSRVQFVNGKQAAF